MHTKFFASKNGCLNLDQYFIKGMLMILFCLFIISIKSKNSNSTFTSNMPIVSLPLKLRWIIYLFLTWKLLEKVLNSLLHFIASLHSIVCLLALRVLYLIWTNTLIFALLHRAFKLCSNFDLFHQEIGNFKTIFRKNDYLVLHHEISE